MKIKEIMLLEVTTVKKENTIAEVLELMNTKRINGAPVVDEEGKLVGMIVKADIYRFLMEEGHYDTYPVNRVMSTEVVTANSEEAIEVVAKRLRYNDIIAIPVVENDNVLGIVCIENILDYYIKLNL